MASGVAAGAAAPSVLRLAMRGVHKRFGATVALDGVDLALAPGEVCALLGENGAGKSTLMKILAGALAPDAGTVALDGAVYRPRGPADARRRGIVMVHQELSLAPHLAVADNVLLGVEPTRLGVVCRDEVARRARAALARLGHGDLPLDRRAGSLPLALQQVVEIARALVLGCRVLVLDEPTSALARPDALRLHAVIADLARQGVTVIHVSHFIDEALRTCSRYVVLRDGRVAGDGSTYGTMAADVAARMVGRRVAELFPRSARTRGEALLDVADLAGRDKPRAASLTLHRGEVLGIAGLVGAGRTELLRAIFGLDPVRAGRIRVAAFTGPASPAARWRQGAGLLGEDRKGEGLALGLSVADNLTLSRLRFGPAGLVLRARQDAAARALVDRLGVRCRGPAQRVGDLSGGNQQKVAFGRLLHHDVDLLLLDEPTRGIDVGSKAQIYALIDDLVSRSRPPKAVLLASSHFPELLGACDRIAVMCRGRLGPARPAAAWTEESLLLEAAGGAAAA